MKKYAPILLVAGFFGITPVYLALVQGVPTRFVTQQAVLLVSLGAFGLMLGQFWLSRLGPRRLQEMGPARVLRWHRVLGYVGAGILLLHPLLIVGRRFWVQESDPIENLLIAVRAPALLPAVVAWILLAAIVLLSLPPSRRSLPHRTWRILHDLFSGSFIALATWHVVAIGRHSSASMSAFWIVLAVAAVARLAYARLPHPSVHRSATAKEKTHVSVQIQN